MKQNFLLILLAASLFTSCSAYKSGQTPDDVYYSPAKEVKEEPKKQTEDYTSNDDNYLRMKVHSYKRWTVIDDYSYWNDTRYDYNCNQTSYIKTSYGYNTWYPHYYGNNWNNPYYALIPYKNPKVYTGNTTASNVKAYQNNKYNNTNSVYNPKTGSGTYGNGNGFGSLVKKAFSSNNGSTSTWNQPSRSFDTKSSTSTPPATSSSAGGNSGGYNSTGSSSSSGRGGRN